MKTHTPILSLLLIFLFSCSIEPQPMEYGQDMCHNCSMTIVDQQHAAQIVTSKGRAYKFDAIECMVNYLKGIDTSEIAMYLINDYSDPGSLIDAESATYLISPEIPSPMGENLSGFSDKSVAEKVHEEAEGELLTWTSLLAHFKGRTSTLH